MAEIFLLPLLMCQICFFNCDWNLQRLRCHTRITGGRASSITVTRSCTFALPCISSFLCSFSALPVVFLAHVIPLAFPDPSFHVIVASLRPISLQVLFYSSVVFFHSSVLRLIVLFFHLFDLSDCLLFSSLPLLQVPSFMWLLAEPARCK